MITTPQKPIPPTSALRGDIDLMRHGDACQAPDLYTFRGTRGDAMMQCRSCGTYRSIRAWMLTDMRTVMEAPPEPPRPSIAAPLAPSPAPAIVSTFRCRTHTDQPVNWKGKGCPQC